MGQWDGHTVAFGSSIGGAIVLFNQTLPKGWIKSFIHRQPFAAMSVFWGLTGISLPIIVPPIRRMLKLPTNQYDAEHPRAVFPKYV